MGLLWSWTYILGNCDQIPMIVVGYAGTSMCMVAAWLSPNVRIPSLLFPQESSAARCFWRQLIFYVRKRIIWSKSIYGLFGRQIFKVHGQLSCTAMWDSYIHCYAMQLCDIFYNFLFFCTEYDALAKVIQLHPDRHETLKYVLIIQKELASPF